jgi:hypothetical protein
VLLKSDLDVQQTHLSSMNQTRKKLSLVRKRGPLLRNSSMLLSSHEGNLTKHVFTGNTKGGSITVPLTSCLNGLELAV